MTKNNKLLIVIFTFIVVCVVGYALFSENITVTGTATAQGTFDTTVTCQTGILSKLGNSYILKNGEDGGYENDSCAVKDNIVTFNTDFLYPNAKRYYTVKITNSGTIDLVYSNANIIISEEMCVSANLDGSNLSCTNTPQADGALYLNEYGANSTLEFAALEDQNGILLSQNDTLKYFNPNLGDLILKPGYSVYMYFRLKVFHSSTRVPEGVMFVEYTSTYELPITQGTN